MHNSRRIYGYFFKKYLLDFDLPREMIKILHRVVYDVRFLKVCKKKSTGSAKNTVNAKDTSDNESIATQLFTYN